MRLFSCSAAPLTLAMLAIGCNTVSPSDCWPNTSGGLGGAGPIPIGAGVGATSGDFRSSPGAHPLGLPAPYNPCVTQDTPGEESTGPGGDGTADPFAGIDPQALAMASLKASAMAYYLDGMINSSGLDPDTVDDATLNMLMTQGTPMAEMVVNDWLATVDPSTVPLAAPGQPKTECILSPYDCPYNGRCLNYLDKSGLPALCRVVNCGDAGCTKCPSWFPDTLKHAIWRSWCAYDCTDNYAPADVLIAVGAVGISSKTGKPYPAPGHIWCVPQ